MSEMKPTAGGEAAPHEPRKPLFYETVASELIDQLKAGTAPWQKPWAPGELQMPHNPVSGHQYKGLNVVHLMAQGHDDPRWMTYKQAQKAKAHVRSGEKGTTVQYWKFEERQPKLDKQGQPVLDADGKHVMETVKLERPKAFFATVFNASQIDGLPEREVQTPVPSWERHERAEAILENAGTSLHHDQRDRAFYSPARDAIHLPAREQFETADRYYATALHELGHATGHESRLGRDLSGPFGSESYAREELRAEIASMMLGGKLGIGHDPGQHAAYVGSWIKVLEDDPMEILRASKDAEQIMGYVLGLEHEREQQQELASVPEPALAAEPQAVPPQPGVDLPPTLLQAHEAPTAILITADHLSAQVILEATGRPVVVADRYGRLPQTAQIVAERYPDSQLFLVGDQADPYTVGFDIEAVKLTGAQTIYPDFSGPEEDQGYVRFADYLQCRTHPFDDIREAIEGPIEAAKQRQMEAALEAEARVTSSPPLDARQAILAHMPELKSPDRFQVMGDGEVPEAADLIVASDHKSAQVVHEVTGRPVVVSPTIAALPDTVTAVQTAYPDTSLHILGNLAPSHEAAIEAALGIEGTALIVLPFTEQDVAEGRKWIHDVYQCRDNPEQAIRDTIEGGIEVASGVRSTSVYEVRADQVAELKAVEKDGTALIIVDHQPSAQVIRNAYAGDERAPDLMLASPEHLSTTIEVAQSRYPEKTIYLLAPVASDPEHNPYQEIAEQHGLAVLSPTFSEEELSQGYKHLSDYGFSRDQVPELVRHEIDTGMTAARGQQAEREAAARPLAPASEVATEKTYLHVPYAEKEAAKTHGAKWDPQAKSWYAPEGTDLAPLAKWREPQQTAPEPPLDARVEFAQALADKGLLLEGLPEMDGQRHKVDVQGAEPGSLKGEYVGYLDGRPAGRIVNHREGIYENWKAKGYALSPEQKAEQQAEIAAKREQRQQERQEGFERAAKDCQRIWRDCEPIQRDEVHPYLAAKGIGAHGVKVAPESGRLVVPLRNADDVIKSLQFVDKESKQFQKGAQTKGHFHLIGQRPPGDPILIAEGYSTAASIHEATGRAVVCAFNSGNLGPVAKVLREREPGVEIVICADNDHH